MCGCTIVSIVRRVRRGRGSGCCSGQVVIEAERAGGGQPGRRGGSRAGGGQQGRRGIAGQEGLTNIDRRGTAGQSGGRDRTDFRFGGHIVVAAEFTEMARRQRRRRRRQTLKLGWKRDWSQGRCSGTWTMENAWAMRQRSLQGAGQVWHHQTDTANRLRPDAV